MEQLEERANRKPSFEDVNSNAIAMEDSEVAARAVATEITTLEYEDDWINRFLYGGPIGLTVNFTLLIALTIYHFLTIENRLKDEFFREEVYNKLWYPSGIYLFTLTLPIDLAMAAIIVFILYPVSRVSRSTSYYWFIGLMCSAAMLTVICIDVSRMMVPIKLLIVSAWIRYCAKVAAFLIECNWSEQVFKESTMKSLTYFLFIPYLIYKTEYPRAKRIRWIKVISHVWWIFIGLFPFAMAMGQFMTRFRQDLLTTSFRESVMLIIELGLFYGWAYMMVVWFFLFGNFNALHGELLRFPHLKMFGDAKNLVKGTEFLAEFNLLASKWLIRYTYIPIIKSTGSRMKALWFACGVSWVMHEVAFFYMAGITVPMRVIIALMFISLNVSIPMKNSFLVFISFVLALFGFILYSSSFPAEFIALNYSSMSCTYDTPRVLLLPLPVTQLFHNFWNKYTHSESSFC